MSSLQNYKVKTPVVMIVYNRPDTTKQVFDRIREVKPEKLLVIADGPKNSTVAESCAAARSVVVDNVDWECQVITNFSEENLGCKKRVSSGLNWVFDTVEEAIILEDDIVPDLSFFKYCDEMLEKYRDDERVMKISGCNILQQSFTDNSYFFAKHGGVWGWASWSRAWKKYDVDIKNWKEVRKSDPTFGGFLRKGEARIHGLFWDMIYFDKFNTWDFQWDYCRFSNHGLVINPRQNLIYNIGFGEDATHTFDQNDPNSDLKVGSLEFPLKHPDKVEIDQVFENHYYDRFLRKPLWKIMVIRVIRWFQRRRAKN